MWRLGDAEVRDVGVWDVELGARFAPAACMVCQGSQGSVAVGTSPASVGEELRRAVAGSPQALPDAALLLLLRAPGTSFCLVLQTLIAAYN